MAHTSNTSSALVGADYLLLGTSILEAGITQNHELNKMIRETYSQEELVNALYSALFFQVGLAAKEKDMTREDYMSLLKTTTLEAAEKLRS